MKKIVLTFLVFFIVQSYFSQEHAVVYKNDLDENALFGKVKDVTVFTSSKKNLEEYSIFDTVRYFSFNKDGFIDNVRTFEDKKVSFSINIFYDSNKNKVQEIRSYKGNNSVDTLFYRYYNEKLIQLFVKNNTGKMVLKKLYFYNELGVMYEEEKTPRSGSYKSPSTITTYIYNGKGVLVEKYNEKDIYILDKTTFNSKGYVTRIEKRDRYLGITYLNKITYDKNNNVLEYSSENYFDNKVDENTSYLFKTSYNKRNLEHVVECSNYSGSFSFHMSYTYKFDDKGNWIEKIGTSLKENESANFVVEKRVINYYN